jgi:uncharacterized damage-inducible protein DinB
VVEVIVQSSEEIAMSVGLF